MARPKGVSQKRNELKYWLPANVTLKLGQIEIFNKETKLIFIDNKYGEFISTYKALQGANDSVHPKALSFRKSQNNPGASKQSREKARQTMLVKYGVEYALKSPEFLKKSKETFNKNNDIEDVLKKMQDTSLERYGHKNPMQSELIKERQLSSLLINHGVTNPNYIPHVAELRLQNLINKNLSSKEELELKAYIESLGLITKKSFIGGASPKELDIKILDKNIAFEMNGLYWHNEKMGKDRKYHLSKTLMCSERGIRLIHIFDKEWHDRKSQIKSFIKSALNKNEITIYARECELKDISSLECREFLDKYHILGKTTMKGAIGLFYKDELLSVISYNKHHRNTGEYLLNRYCTKTNVTIVGGLSRLSKSLYKKIGVFSTFIDLRFSTGQSWLKCGYIKTNTLDPDYFYYNSKTHQVLSKQSRKKSTVNTPSEMTEIQHATLDGLVRVWDCGKIKLKYIGK